MIRLLAKIPIQTIYLEVIYGKGHLWKRLFKGTVIYGNDEKLER